MKPQPPFSLVASTAPRGVAWPAAITVACLLLLPAGTGFWQSPSSDPIPVERDRGRAGGAFRPLPAAGIPHVATGIVNPKEAVCERAVGRHAPSHGNKPIQLCQYVAAAPESGGGSFAPRPFVAGLDSADHCCEPGWNQRRCVPWSPYGPGEYAGPPRTAPLSEYLIRARDVIEFVYRLTRERSSAPYKLEVGDVVNVEFLRDETLSRELTIQPDGMITLPYVGPVLAADRTAEQLQKTLIERFEEFYKTPLIVVTPTQVSTRLEDLRAAVDRRFGRGGQAFATTVTPEGTIQLPGIGSVRVQGLTLPEVKREIDERYDTIVGGIEVSPILVERAPTFVYVLGEVAAPGRYNLDAPTTAMQAMALAGGWNVGANLRQIVVFRRAEDWRLVATMLDLRGAVYGKRPLPSDEIWLRDSDILLVPKSPILVFDDAVNLVFTNGFYSILPSASIGWGFREYRLL
jgi:polysaccharide export outer membrane protein